jgi:hypothetical protein
LRRLTYSIVLVSTFLLATSAWAETRRYALLVGANEGAPEEVPLRYAVRDAERLADALRSVGGVNPENLVVLDQPDARSVERVLDDLHARIELANEKHGDDDALLLFFYSGHADPTALHLGRSLLDFDKLKSWMEASPARTQVLVVDACRSGGVTRVKGAKPAAPFKIEASESTGGEGLAIITSSAAGEDALESERLKGSFFTHHFVAGLLGPADSSRDGRVTLTEAYRYAYVETLRTTTRAATVQHPTYSFKLKGHTDLVMARLDDARGERGVLTVVAPGTYVFFRDDEDGELVAETTIEADTQVVLEAGTYLVRRRTQDGVYQALVRVPEAGTASLDASSMKSVPAGQVIRKGMVRDSSAAWSLQGGFLLSGEILPGTGALSVGMLGAQLDLDALSLQGRVRYGRSATANQSVDLDQQLLGGELTALKLFDFGTVTPGAGLRVGADWLQQSFSTPGSAPDRNGVLLRGGAVLHTSWAASRYVGVFGELSAEANLLRTSSLGAEKWDARLVPQGMLGLTVYLP